MNDEHAMNGTPRRRLPLCGAKTRSDGVCKRPAGSGTDHIGFGTCRHHAGSTPSGRQAAARQQALEELHSVGELDDVDPVEALQVAVNLAHARLAHLHSRGGDAPDVTLARLEGAAVDRLVRTANAALDSNLLERRAWLAERTDRPRTPGFPLYGGCALRGLHVSALDATGSGRIVGDTGKTVLPRRGRVQHLAVDTPVERGELREAADAGAHVEPRRLLVDDEGDTPARALADVVLQAVVDPLGASEGREPEDLDVDGPLHAID
jgi:hypothetical protein